MNCFAKASIFAFSFISFLSASFAQTNKGTADTSVDVFYKIRNEDFAQLSGASTAGVGLSYDDQKTLLNLSYGILKPKESSLQQRSWLNIVGAVGTTKTLFKFGDPLETPDYSLGFIFNHIQWESYKYDGTFSKNFDAIKGKLTLRALSTDNENGSGGFYYTENLRNKVQGGKVTESSPIYTTKKFFWYSIKGDIGKSAYQFYDGTKPFAAQIFKEKYGSKGITGSLNFYAYYNHQDIKWVKGSGVPRFVRVFFVTFSGRFGTNSNIDLLKKTNITDVTTTSTSGPTTRQATKASNPYTGKFEHFTAFTPSAELIYSPIEFMALDIFYNASFIMSNNISITNFSNWGIGPYFSTSTSGSKLNLGIFYQRTKEFSGSNLVKEQIGIKTKLPISGW